MGGGEGVLIDWPDSQPGGNLQPANDKALTEAKYVRLLWEEHKATKGTENHKEDDK